MNPVPSPPFPPSYARHQPRVYLFALGAARRTGPGLEDVRVVAQVCVRVAGRTNFARDKTSQRTRPTHTRRQACQKEQSLQRKQQRLNARCSAGRPGSHGGGKARGAGRGAHLDSASPRTNMFKPKTSLNIALSLLASIPVECFLKGTPIQYCWYQMKRCLLWVGQLVIVRWCTMEKRHLTYSKRTIRQFGGIDPSIRPLQKVTREQIVPCLERAVFERLRSF